MIIKKYRTILSVLFVISLNATATDTLTIEACRDQAIQYNREIKQADLQKQEAVEYQKVAKTTYLPSVSAEASVMHRFQDIDVTLPAGAYMATAESQEDAQNGIFNGVGYVNEMQLVDMDHLTMINASLNLIQPLYMGGKIHYANKQADIGVSMAQNMYLMKFDEVIELTDQAFWQVATIEANIELAESYILMLNELSEQVGSMYELGLTPKSELLKITVQKNEAELQLLKANNGLKVAKMYLNQIIGNDLNAEVAISYTLDDAPPAYLNIDANQALQNRSELRLVQEQVDMAEYDKKIAQSDYLPTAGVSLQYSTIYLNEIYDDVELTPSIGAQVSIPIFAWGQGRKKQKAADFAIEQKQEEMLRTKELLQLEILQVEIQLMESIEEIALAQKNINEAQESLEETKASFDVGINSTTDLLDAQANWQNAKAQLITAKANNEILNTTWLRVTGQLPH